MPLWRRFKQWTPALTFDDLRSCIIASLVVLRSPFSVLRFERERRKENGERKTENAERNLHSLHPCCLKNRPLHGGLCDLHLVPVLAHGPCAAQRRFGGRSRRRF